METHEFTASTVEEATAAASEKLGVPAEQLEIKVLDQSKGLFGKGTVRVQATLKQPAEEPAAEKAPEKPSRKPRATKAKPKEEAPKSLRQKPWSKSPRPLCRRGSSKRSSQPKKTPMRSSQGLKRSWRRAVSKSTFA
ncbi:conserved hypothetical protein [Candidatus Nitrosymbiomonas proteolyticus]|uniref:RNA-binding protein KhpB N-terminal domain-containing protein n=1 Tax=Candidatus Nitrosymbiomonas proteolyticus TaxID=2608984 RepID=A0A809R5M6_9BACT|nr:conserved hypothetical protein [Candidatus Nitrosymbiomonas proteolyticus]